MRPTVTKVRLTIGLETSIPKEFRSIIHGLGLPFADVSKPVSPETFSCLLSMDASLNASYAQNGGVIIAPSKTWPKECARRPPLSLPFAVHDLGWISGEESFSVKRIELQTATYGKGGFVEFPEGLLAAWQNTELWTTHFHCGKNIESYASENTPAYAKENIQRLLLIAIQHACLTRNLPLVGASRYPKGATNIFCYRFDCDGGSPEHMAGVVSRFASEVPTQSYHFNVSTYENQPELAKAITLNGGRVDNHSYVHKVLNASDIETRNIKLAHQWIKKNCGRPPRGFVCPGSGFNPAALPFLAEEGYRYFNSWGWDHSTLPYQMVINGQQSSLWNMAYHPVSLGRLLKAIGYDLAKITHYFSCVIAARQNRRDPHFYYCHPEERIGKYPEVYEVIRDASLKYPGVRPMHVEDYCDYMEKAFSNIPEMTYDTASGQLHTGDARQWKDIESEPWLYNEKPEPLQNELPQLTPLLFSLEPGDTLTRSPQSQSCQMKEIRDFYAHDDWRLKFQINTPKLYAVLQRTKYMLRRA